MQIKISNISIYDSKIRFISKGKIWCEQALGIGMKDTKSSVIYEAWCAAFIINL